jgi:S1-C subfamily serine protease
MTELVDPGVAAANGLDVEEGALVTDVAPDSPADQAGIEPGDVIVEVDGLDVSNPEDVREGVRRNEPGDSIPVVVDRGGDKVQLDVTLDVLPEGSF